MMPYCTNASVAIAVIGRILPAVLLVAAGPVHAVPLIVTVDEGASNVTVTLSINLLGNDSDSSSVSGTMLIDVDDMEFPTEISILDMDLVLNDTINLSVGNIILGMIDVTGTNRAIHYANAPIPFGPTAVVADAFSFVAVPTDAEGMVDYSASGLACTLLTDSGLPCDDTVNLADQGPQATDINGTIIGGPTLVDVTIDPSLEIPLDAKNPDLGTLTISGTIVGIGEPAPVIPALSQSAVAISSVILLAVGVFVLSRGEARSASRA